MFAFILIAGFQLLIVNIANVAGQVDANAYCFQCSQRRNHKDTYPDPAGDCHSFYKCQYINDTYAIGTKMSCPVATYWHDEVLACLPEGSTPCQDLCQNSEIRAQGCYNLPGNCASYFVCSNTASYAFCCSPRTSFNLTTCQCDNDLTCKDSCVTSSPSPTIETPPQNFGTYCIHSFKNRLEPAIDPTHFTMVSGDETFTVSCQVGTTFSLESCRCEGELSDQQTQPPKAYRQCALYLPFDDNTNDNSASHFFTELIQPASIDKNLVAKGAGSLLVNGGHLEIPGLKSFGFTDSISICLFYRCQTPGCTGGIYSSNKDDAMSDFGAIASAQPNNGLLLQGSSLQFQDAVTYSVDTSTNTPSGFTQFCISLNSTSANVYINNVLAKRTPIPKVQITNFQCPVAIGTDQHWGDFDGNIDEVLVCKFGITAEDVAAHWNGRSALAAAGLIPN